MRRKRRPTLSLFSFQDIMTSVTGVLVLVTLMLTLALVTQSQLEAEVDTTQLASQITAMLTEIREQLSSSQREFQRTQEIVLAGAALSPGDLARQRSLVSQQVESLTVELKRLDAQQLAAKRKLISAQSRQFDRRGDHDKLVERQREVESLKAELEQLQSTNRVIYNPMAESGKRPWLVEINRDVIVICEPGYEKQPISFDGADIVQSFLDWASTRDQASEYFVLLVRPEAVQHYEEISLRLEQSQFDLGIDVIGRDVNIMPSETRGR